MDPKEFEQKLNDIKSIPSDSDRVVSAIDKMAVELGDIITELHSDIADDTAESERNTAMLDKLTSIEAAVSTVEPPDDANVVSALEGVRTAVNALKLNPVFNPQISVKPADVTVSAPDLAPITEAIDSLKAVIAENRTPATDLTALMAAVEATTSAIENLRFPTPSIPKTVENKPFTTVPSSVTAGIQAVAIVNPDGTNVGGGSGGGLTDAQLRVTPVPVSGPLTDTQLRATSVPISNADLTALRTDMETRFISGKLSYGATLNTPGDNIVITPGSGQRVVVYWVAFIPNSDNTAANLVTVKFATSAINMYVNYAIAHSEIFTGAINEVVTVNLTNTQPVAVNIHYKLI